MMQEVYPSFRNDMQQELEKLYDVQGEEGGMAGEILLQGPPQEGEVLALLVHQGAQNAIVSIITYFEHNGGATTSKLLNCK